MVSRFGPSTADPASLAARSMRWHTIAYVVVVGALNVVNVFQGAPWWAFWPTFGWGLVYAIHYFIYKAMNVDEEWVDQRAQELRQFSYDFDHMKDMQQRISDDHFSLRSHSDDANGNDKKE